MTRRKKQDWRSIKKIAERQIISYFEDIERMKPKDIELANRYVDICRRIAMRCKVRIPRIYKRQICNKCKGILIPGITARVRVRNNKRTHVTITCLRCKNYKRLYIDKSKGR